MYALIKNNTVRNVIECDANFAAKISSEWDYVVPAQGAAIGWSYSEGAFTAPDIQPGYSRKLEIQTRLIEIDFITDKPRTRRELALSKNATRVWLQTLDDEAESLRTELAILP